MTSYRKPHLFFDADDYSYSLSDDEGCSDYPVFDALRYNQEFSVLHTRCIPDMQLGLDSIDTEVHFLSPVVLDRSRSHGFNATDLYNIHGVLNPQSNVKKQISKKSEITSIQCPNRPSISSFVASCHPNSITAHQITSIHPSSKGKQVRTENLRHKNEDLGKQVIHDDLPRKPLGEYLSVKSSASNSSAADNSDDDTDEANDGVINTENNEIQETKCNKNQISNPSNVTKTSTIEEVSLRRKSKSVTDMSGCLQCDNCFPAGKLTVVPLTDSRDYTQIPPKERDFSGNRSAKKDQKAGSYSLLSSLFKSKKKPHLCKVQDTEPEGNGTNNAANDKKSSNSCQTEASTVTIDENRTDVAKRNANEDGQVDDKRDATEIDVLELKSAIQVMGKKLGQLESQYKSLRFLTRIPASKYAAALATAGESLTGLSKSACPKEENRSSFSINPGLGPNKKEFCHAVVEARVGIKQFCRTLVQELEDQSSIDRIEEILQANNITTSVVTPKGTVSKPAKYYIEYLINQAFYENFENIRFKKSGNNCVLDPKQRPLVYYKTFMGVSQVGWKELIDKESSAYSESFDSFCDEKMNKLVDEVLHWDIGEWPDELARAFFVAAKWVWLLHLLAFSFEHPAMIFRVGNECRYDPLYMEELPTDHIVTHSGKIKLHYFANSVHDHPPYVLAMVMPGFFFNSYEVIRCKVMLADPLS